PEPEGEERADREPDGGVDQSDPLPEHETAEDARDLARNGRHHHLQGLDEDEDDGGGRAPLHELVLHELVVVEETVEEAIGRRVRPHEGDTVRACGRGGAGSQRPRAARGQGRPPAGSGNLTRGPLDPDRGGGPSRSAATSGAGRAVAPPGPSARRTTRWARA